MTIILMDTFVYKTIIYSIIKSTNGRVLQKTFLKKSNDGRKIIGTFFVDLKINCW